MSKRFTGQLDLFAPKPRRHDEALLLKRLREEVEYRTPVAGFSRAQVRMLMTPLPRITALD